MVGTDDSAQLFTIEGIIAGLIMLSTAFIVIGSVNIYTPGDAHISDMQLKQLGSDALLMMDTPDNYGEKSKLRIIVENVSAGGAKAEWAKSEFHTVFGDALKTGTGTTDIIDSIRYNTTVYFRDGNKIDNYPLGETGSEIARQPSVSTGRLVLVDDSGTNKIFRVEVRLWRE